MESRMSSSQRRAISSRAISRRARRSWWRTRNCLKPRLPTNASAASTCLNFSAVMPSPYWNREERQGGGGRAPGGGGGIVGGREVELAGELPDLRLPERRVDQGRPHPHALRRLHARAMIAQVVHIGAVDEVRPPFPRCQRLEFGEQLFLAEEAAV